MRFGLLCDDPAAAPVLAAIQRSAAHALTRAVLVSPQTDALLHGIGGVQCGNRWEDLVTADNVDAVLIGGNASETWDGARRLASEGIPLLVLPTLRHGAATLYELSLIRDDRQGVLFPLWRHRLDPEWGALRDWCRSPDRPAIRYLQWERDVGLGAGAEVPNSVIQEELFHAADALQFLFGAADQVTTLRTGGTATGALIQSVVVAGRGIPETTWTIRSSAQGSSRLTLQTEGGAWVLDWDAEALRWKTSQTDLKSPSRRKEFAEFGVRNAGSESRNEAIAGDDRAAALVAEFAEAVAGGNPENRWLEVLRAAEVVDAAERSLARRRTIELHHETLSERAIFKTQMAAMGCGVLVLTLLLMLGYLAMASVAPLDPRILKVLRVLVFAPLFVFLLLQLLLPLTRTADDGSKSGVTARS
jgi:hypothetical protein